MSRWRDRIRISGGFWLLAAWFTLVNGWQLLAVILSAAALHELGHLLVLRLLGARVRELRVSVFGAELMTSAARLSYPGEIAAVLAGPAVNLLCALVLGGAHAWVAAGAHLSLCLFNLLPVRPLDGGRALYLAAAWLAGPSAAERIACWAGGTTALALGGLVLWLIGRTGGSLWPSRRCAPRRLFGNCTAERRIFCKKYLHFPPGRGILLRLQRVVLCRAHAGVR